MRRRSFLKLIALGGAAASLPAAGSAAASTRRSAAGSPASTAAPGQRLYRGRGGRIFTSADGGRTWQLHSYLGPEYDVTRVRTDGAGGAAARVDYRGESFTLTLASDLQSWLTD